MKKQNNKQTDPLRMLLRIFRVADILATVVHDDDLILEDAKHAIPKTQK